MKCTSKKLITLVISIILSFGCVACSNSDISLSYDTYKDMQTETFADRKATSFANDLCVVNGNVTKNTDVDLEEQVAAGLFDVKNREVIYAKNIHERLHPASLTKIMTAVVALKYGNTEDVITVSDRANKLETGATMCGLREGDHLTLNQALHALLIHSANDAGVAIAEHIGGSVEGFSELMNKEAVAIGATNSHFMNPHGLTENDHYTTAYDMYLIMNEAMQYDLINEIIHMSEYSTVYTDKEGNDKEMSFKTTNLFLRGEYSSPERITVIGGKTGTTNAAGNCLLLITKDTAGNPYISVILRASERSILYNNMIDILDEING